MDRKWPGFEPPRHVCALLLETLGNQKAGATAIVKHVDLFVKLVIPKELTYEDCKLWSESISKLVCNREIADALVAQGGIELLIHALQKGEESENVPLALQCLVYEHEDFAHRLIAEGGWKMMVKGMQHWGPPLCYGWLRHKSIAKKMASKGEIQKLLMGVIHQKSDFCCRILGNLVTGHGDIMREEMVVKGGI